MNIFQVTQIGTFHTNHNEDHLISRETGKDKLIIAVMDGCSMGIDSHFASALTGKILNKITRELHYRAFFQKGKRGNSAVLKEIFQKLFESLFEIKNQLLLETEELLTTIILGVIDSERKSAEILTVGDGLIAFNGRILEYEQDDKPDYLGYHLNESFEQWFEKQQQRLSIPNIKNLSISTDGIFSFKPFHKNEYDPVTTSEIVEFLLSPSQTSDTDYLLKKRLIQIERKWGLKPSDDLSVIIVEFQD